MLGWCRFDLRADLILDGLELGRMVRERGRKDGLVCLGLLALVLGMLPAAAQEPWRVGLPGQDYPLSYLGDEAFAPGKLDDTPPLAGYMVEWWQRVASRVGRSLELVACEPTQCRALLRSGALDFAGPLLHSSAAGDRDLPFSRPVVRRYTLGRDLNAVLDSRLNFEAFEGRRVVLSGAHPHDIGVVERLGGQIAHAAEAADLEIRGGLADVQSRGQRYFPLWFRWAQVYAGAPAQLMVLEAALEQTGLGDAGFIEERAALFGLIEFLPAHERQVVSQMQLAALSEHPLVTMGASAWPPLTVIAKQGGFDGIGIRLARFHLQRSGLTPWFRGESNWQQVASDALHGQYDGLGYVVGKGTTVAPLVLSKSMFDMPAVVVVRNDTGEWTDLGALRGKKVAIDEQYSDLHARLSELGVERIVLGQHSNLLLRKVQTGEVDAWVEYLPVVNYDIQRSSVREVVRIALNIGGVPNTRVALNQRFERLIPLLNRSIESTSVADRNKIFAQWASEQVRLKPPVLLLLVILLLCSGIVLLLRYLTRSVRVARRRGLALQRVQVTAGVGSFELRPPYSELLLDANTPKMLGLGTRLEKHSLEDHVALFSNGDDLRHALTRIHRSGVPLSVDLVRRERGVDEQEDGANPPLARRFRYDISLPQSTRWGRSLIHGAIKDVTEEHADLQRRRILEQEVLQLQKIDAVGGLAQGVAHDFNNILMASMAHTELALGRLDSNHPAYENLRSVMRASERSRDLVQRILQFSRRNSDAGDKIRWDLTVRESVELLRASTPASVELHLSLPAEPVWVQGDENQLSQVLINLVSNAVDAVGGAGQVWISLAINKVTRSPGLETDMAVLSVRDNGTGIAPDVRGRVFDPFFTTKPTGEGIGLGLSIVQGVMRRHKGVVNVSTSAEGGAEFVVTLPLVAAETEDTTLHLQDRRGGGERIMVVDDEAAIVESLQVLLTNRGFGVEGFTHPELALRAIESNPRAYDLVLTDLTMPKMTGVELAAKIRQLDATLPMLLMTGYGVDAGYALTTQFIRVLQKPVNGDQLIGYALTALATRAA